MAFVKTVEYCSFTDVTVHRLEPVVFDDLRIFVLHVGKYSIHLNVSFTPDRPRSISEIFHPVSKSCRIVSMPKQLTGLESGLIRIGTFSSVATHLLPQIIKEFQKNYPNIDSESRFIKIIAKFIDHEAVHWYSTGSGSRNVLNKFNGILRQGAVVTPLATGSLMQQNFRKGKGGFGTKSWAAYIGRA